MKDKVNKPKEKSEFVEETQEQKEVRWAKNRKMAKRFAKMYY